MNKSFDVQTFLKNFLSKEETSGFLLLIFAAFALIIVNSPLQSLYYDLKYLPLSIDVGEFSLSKSVEHWVNDGLMAIFFFVIGLELKREMLEGELSSFSKIVSPGIAAIGGMVIPALIYIYVNYDVQENLVGWAIPTATDIAFSLAILLIIGSRVPIGLKIFLLSLAIIDDLGAVLIIAFFYSSDLQTLYLIYAAIFFSTLIGINLLGIQQKLIYLALGIFLWYCILKSGVHGTLAGVLLAATIPNNTQGTNGTSMLKDLEQPVHHFVGLFILPLFAFFNSDINFQSLSFESFMSPLSMGIMLGLILGKPIGITLFAYIAVKLKVCDLPDGIKMVDILGLSFLCGIGFTMSLFINNLAFTSAELIDSSKLGIFVGSIVAAIIGYKILKKRFG
tara:strand:+ start:457 stop:1632 length:1176 start_codon:yes stop_codon:yes gene_type:complete